MEQFKRAKVELIPTQNKTNIILDKNKLEFIKKEQVAKTVNSSVIGYHLYIILDDEIKEGDFKIVYSTLSGDMLNIQQHQKDEQTTSNQKKIIASTDKSLIQHKQIIDKNEIGNLYNLVFLPQLSQQFIEKYIEEYNKGNTITDVLVGYEADLSTITRIDYCLQHWDCKLKVNPKDNTVTIKKVKDSWTREEIKNIVTDVLYNAPEFIELFPDGSVSNVDDKELNKYLTNKL